MKAIYIKPLTELVTLNTQVVLEKEQALDSDPYDTADANDAFFVEEDYDDEYDPFFDE